jgi:Zn-dependent protease
MDTQLLFYALLTYLCFLPVLTFHEFAHAWVAWKCGDDTAKTLGRVSLNPIRHMELIGTVILPLAAIYLQMSHSPLGGFIIGWGKPVPVNPNNLRRPRLDDTLIALAGPGMNFLLAFALMFFVKIGVAGRGTEMEEIGSRLATLAGMLVSINLILAFFNLLPIPPLDGSHLLKNAINMSYETYFRFAQMGIIIIILVLNFTPVRHLLGFLIKSSMDWLYRLYGVHPSLT